MRCPQIRHRGFFMKLGIFDGGGRGKAEPPPGTHGQKSKRSPMCTWGGAGGAEPPPGT